MFPRVSISAALRSIQWCGLPGLERSGSACDATVRSERDAAAHTYERPGISRVSAPNCAHEGSSLRREHPRPRTSGLRYKVVGST